MSHLSLWLVPDEPARSRLAGLIADRAARLRAPLFAPHLTVLSGLRLDEAEVIRRARDLPRRMRPLSLRLTHLSHAAAYYRCVVLEAEPTPELLGAHQKARRAMAAGPDRFRPHLSLVYGRLDERARRELVSELEGALPLPLVVEASRVEIHSTAGPPRRWKLAASFGLAQG
jgi:hypothetical protein